MPSQSPPTSLMERVRNANVIQLDIPSKTPSGRYWAPHQHTPSVALARLKDVSLSELPEVETVTSGPDVTLCLTDRIGYHNLFDIYHASIDGVSGLVVKVVDLAFFALVEQYKPIRSGVARHLCREYDAYNNILADLQGSVVPYFGGMFARGSLYCTIYEDAGRLLSLNEVYFNRALGDQILEAVKATHAAGIATSPKNWMGICLDKNDHVKLTDFADEGTIANSAHSKETLRRRPNFANRTDEEFLASWCKRGLEMAKELMGRDRTEE